MKLTYQRSINYFTPTPRPKGMWSNPKREHKKVIMSKFRLSSRQWRMWRKGLTYLEV